MLAMAGVAVGERVPVRDVDVDVDLDLEAGRVRRLRIGKTR